MNTPRTPLTIIFTLTSSLLGLPACGPGQATEEGEASDEGDVGSSTSAGTSSTGADTSSTSVGTSSTQGSESDSSDSSSEESDTIDFVPPGPDLPLQCDPFAQDCPEGEKCVPFSLSGGGGWDSNSCVPVLGDQVPGEPCHYDGVDAGTDDCDAASWCFYTDAEGDGFCVGFCTGSPEDPQCPPQSACLIDGGGVFNLCVPECHPLLQDCPGELACYWNGGSFQCSGTVDNLGAGEPCRFLNQCEPGLICANADALPECEGAACCTSFCDLGDPEGCQALPGTSCQPFEDADFAELGWCLL